MSPWTSHCSCREKKIAVPSHALPETARSELSAQRFRHFSFVVEDKHRRNGLAPLIARRFRSTSKARGRRSSRDSEHVVAWVWESRSRPYRERRVPSADFQRPSTLFEMPTIPFYAHLLSRADQWFLFGYDHVLGTRDLRCMLFLALFI